ncbi:hypothetical protein C4588_00340 [Candidatus Parcubacteria bacterium]|nr:MAG: hypothetical protein C4588_00340 [Candidatus Parcubacteria bacterium]
MAWSADDDSPGGGGYNDAGQPNNRSGGGRNLGLGSGPYSAIDPNTGDFLGVIDDSKNTFEKWATNFQTNLSKKWSDLSGFQKLGMGASALSSPGLALAGAVFLGGKSLAQALSTPGLTESDKKALTEAVNNYDSLPEQDKAQIRNEAESIAGPVDGTTTPGLLNTKLKSNFGDTDMGTSNYSYNMNSPQVWEDYVNSNYDKALAEYRNQATKINAATDKQTGVLDTLISGLQSGNNMNPISAKIGDQTISWIPRANRDTATQISDLLGKRTTGEYTSALGGNANLNYLERLKDLAEMEQKKIAVDKGVDINQQQLEQNEPGLLDYAKGIGSLFSGVSGLFK